MAARHAELRFYAELNDFLPAHRRFTAFTHEFELPGSVKDMVESLGVPHTEIDLIVVNGASVGFGHQVADGDRIGVYPVFESLDISPVVRLRAEPLREPRFVADVHLGRLARHLRLLGFDTRYGNDLDDAELARVSVDDHRTLLTRDVGLLKRGEITHGLFIRSTDSDEQAVEVLRRLDLLGRIDPFTRCLECNGGLEDVPKEDIADRLPPDTRRRFENFRRCRSCERVYWRGSHHDRLVTRVEALRSAATGDAREQDPPT